jgi:hypothetical protein
MLCALFFRTGTVYVENPGIAASGLIGDFWGSNGEASPYPSACVVRSSASSSARLTGKPFFRIGPFMVELFAVEGFAFDRRMSHIRSRLSPVESSPRQPG